MKFESIMISLIRITVAPVSVEEETSFIKVRDQIVILPTSSTS